MKFESAEQLVKFAIRYFYKQRRMPCVSELNVTDELRLLGACFVSLHSNGELRGCIGSCEAKEALYLNIIRNAINAGFFDSRFRPLQEDELAQLNVEVSVLTPLEPYQPQNMNELLQFLQEKRPGLLIKGGGHTALFLPQVWRELSAPSEFLSHLCLKAELPAFAWKNNELEYWTFYTA